MYLHMLPPNKKNVPELLKDPIALIQDVRTLIGLHRQDNKDLAITGRPILNGTVLVVLEMARMEIEVVCDVVVPEDQESRLGKLPSPNKVSPNKGLPKPPRTDQKIIDKNGPRRRRTR